MLRIGLVSVLLATAAAEANAQWLTPRTCQSEVTTRGPVHGRSGFVRFGASQLYCDYQRIPNRTCTIDRSGRERCKVVSWTLKQFCY